jgi:hypothetical protein
MTLKDLGCKVFDEKLMKKYGLFPRVLDTREWCAIPEIHNDFLGVVSYTENKTGLRLFRES